VFIRLVQALADPEERVRCSAASALGYYGDPRAISALRELLSNSSDRVRYIVEFALQQLEKAG
jgi:HEAT repeat protein